MRNGNWKHGMEGSREYSSWVAMKSRCLDENNDKFSRYGGRGVTVSRRWMRFENFFRDMGRRPAGMTLERKDNSKGYCKSNCRWATAKEQARNRRSNKAISFRGNEYVMSELAEKLGMSSDTLGGRLSRGWSIERACTEQLHRRNRRPLAAV